MYRRFVVAPVITNRATCALNFIAINRRRRHSPERVDETVVDGRSERFRHTRVPAAVDDVTVVTLVLTFDVQSQKETKNKEKTTCVLSRAATDPENPDQYDRHQ